MTDPPYGIEHSQSWDAFGRERAYAPRTGYRNKGLIKGYGRGGRSQDVSRFHAKANADFGLWCAEWCAEVARALKPGAYFAAFSSSRTIHRLACAVEDAGLEIRGQIAWKFKPGMPRAKGTALRVAHDPLVLARKPLAEATSHQNAAVYGTGRLTETDGGYPSDVLEFPKERKPLKTDLPVKPLALTEYLVRLLCPENGIVLDPFAGSGTTGVAARKAGRRFLLIENDPEALKVASQRLPAAP